MGKETRRQIDKRQKTRDTKTGTRYQEITQRRPGDKR